MKVVGYYVLRFQESRTEVGWHGEPEAKDYRPTAYGPFRTRAEARSWLTNRTLNSTSLWPWVGVIVRASEAKRFTLFASNPEWSRRLSSVVSQNTIRPRRRRR